MPLNSPAAVRKKSPEKPAVVSPEQTQMMKFQEDMINQSQQMFEMMQKNPAFNPAAVKGMQQSLSTSSLPPRDEAGITWAKNRVVTAATTQTYLQSVTASAEKALPLDAVKRAEAMLSAQQKIDGSPQAIMRLATLTVRLLLIKMRITSRNTCEARLLAALQQGGFVLKMVKMWYFVGCMVLVVSGDAH